MKYPLYVKPLKGLLFCFLLGLVVFSSCSKESNTGGDTPDASGELTGVLLDSEVEGVFYRLIDDKGKAVDSGYTDASGKFKYKKGLKIAFYINSNVFLGEVEEGKAQVTPIDLSDETDADENSELVRRIAALLQTLDEDGDPDNGIQIKKATRDAITNKLYLKRKDFRNKLEDMVDGIEKTRNKRLKVRSTEDAAKHLTKTLKKRYKPQDKISAYFLKVFQNLESGNSKFPWLHRTDEDGILKRSFVRYQGKLTALYVHKYDATNKVITTTERRWLDGTEDLDQASTTKADQVDYVKYTWGYDAEGKLKEYTKEDGSGETSKVTEIVIDEDNQRIKSAKGKDGASDVKRVKEYDKNGRLKAIRIESVGGSKLKTILYTYNNNDQLTKVEVKDASGKVQSTQEITYDTLGKIISKVDKDAKGKVLKSLKKTSKEELKKLNKQLTGGLWYQYETVSSVKKKDPATTIQFYKTEVVGHIEGKFKAQNLILPSSLGGADGLPFIATKKEIVVKGLAINPNAIKAEDKYLRIRDYKIDATDPNALKLTFKYTISGLGTKDYVFKKENK